MLHYFDNQADWTVKVVDRVLPEFLSERITLREDPRGIDKILNPVRYSASMLIHGPVFISSVVLKPISDIGFGAIRVGGNIQRKIKQIFDGNSD